MSQPLMVNNNAQLHNTLSTQQAAKAPTAQVSGANATEKIQAAALNREAAESPSIEDASAFLVSKLGKQSLERMQTYSPRALDGVEAYRMATNPVRQPSKSAFNNTPRTHMEDSSGLYKPPAATKSSMPASNTGCKTCQERTYQDGSSDPGVSFQTPSHVSSATAGISVASHEREHVTRETANAQEEGRVVTQAKVTTQMACCPECHKMYVAGGLTTIQTKPANEQLSVSSAADNLQGENVDFEL